MRFDALNLYYAHGRWYNPETALFLSPDENGEYLYGSGQDAVNWVWFSWGFNCQFYNDITLGLYEYPQPLSLYRCQDFSGNEFYIGRLVGRAASDLLAYLEMYVGGTTFVGGGGLTIISGGSLAQVSVPAAIGGAALTSHGVTVLVRNTLTPITFAKKSGTESSRSIQPRGGPPTGSRRASRTPSSWQEAEQILERDLGIPKNNQNLRYEGMSQARRPDFIGDDFIADAKWYDKAIVDFDKQMQDFLIIARAQGKPLWIYVRQNSNVATTVERELKALGGGIVRYFP